MISLCRRFCIAAFATIFAPTLFSAALLAQSHKTAVARVKYISPEAIYINAGRAEGVRSGDTLSVSRDGRRIAVLVVAHLATHSAACRVVKASRPPQVGDRVTFRPATAAAPAATAGAASQQPPQTARNSRKAPVSSQTKRRSSRRHYRKNRVHGNVAVGGYWSQDLSGGNRSFWQASVSGKLTVENVAGSGLDFRYHQRSRRYTRTRAASSSLPTSEWAHRIYEFALVKEDEAHGRSYGFGRVVVPSIRGIGYLDGAHFSTRLSPLVSVGLVAGLEPILDSPRLQSNWPKYGVFVELHHLPENGDQWRSTLAFSGSMRKGLVDREFVYMQNQIWLGSRFSLFQSVEMDVNRGWRQAAEGQRFRFSNVFLNVNYRPWSAVSLYFSYDARRQVHSYLTHDLPDSLFDATTRQGVNGGISFYLPRHVYLNLNGGLRFREAGIMDNRYASLLLRARRFPFAGHSMSLRFSFFQTQFTRGYRPLLSYSFPVRRGFPVNISVGGYLYETGGVLTTNYYSELRAFHYFPSNYYLSGSVRRYWDQRLQSMQLYLELGKSF